MGLIFDLTSWISHGFNSFLSENLTKDSSSLLCQPWQALTFIIKQLNNMFHPINIFFSFQMPSLSISADCQNMWFVWFFKLFFILRQILDSQVHYKTGCISIFLYKLFCWVDINKLFFLFCIIFDLRWSEYWFRPLLRFKNIIFLFILIFAGRLA